MESYDPSITTLYTPFCPTVPHSLVVAQPQRVVYLLVAPVHLGCRQKVMQRVPVVLPVEVQQSAVYEDLQLQLISQQQHNTIVLEGLETERHMAV